MRVHDSQAYRKMDVTRERISRILELREILLSIQTGFSLSMLLLSVLSWRVSQAWNPHESVSGDPHVITSAGEHFEVS